MYPLIRIVTPSIQFMIIELIEGVQLVFFMGKSKVLILMRPEGSRYHAADCIYEMFYSVYQYLKRLKV